jgi:hypothetical protein
VHLELITVPGLGTLTTRLASRVSGTKLEDTIVMLTVLRVVILRTLVGRRTGPFTRSCLSFARLMRSAETICGFSRYLGGEGEGGRTLLQVLDVAARQGDADFVNFGSGDSTCCIVLLVLSDVTHSGLVFERGMSQKVTTNFISVLKVEDSRICAPKVLLSTLLIEIGN